MSAERMKMFRKTFAEINLDAWAYNVSLLQKYFIKAPLMCPMIKANAYGHGDIELARVLEDLKVRQMGVCLLEEGLRLRQAGIKNEILVFRSFDRAGAVALLEAQLTPVVSDWRQLKILEDVVEGQATVHLKFDTGMNRLGFEKNEAEALCKYLKNQKKIRVEAILTHLSHGEDAVSLDGISSGQLKDLIEIENVFDGFDVYLHALNSAGCVAKMSLSSSESCSDHPLLLKNWGVRPGLMTYGYNPIPSYTGISLKPVMTFKSEVSAVRSLEVGESVSYSGTFKVQKPSIIIVVPAGYADGYHRILSNKSTALVCGQALPLVGNVCMDYMMFDATKLIESGTVKSAQDLIGEEVVLFGTDSNNNFLSADEIGKRAQTISYEILTSVGERVPRIFKRKSGEM